MKQLLTFISFSFILTGAYAQTYSKLISNSLERASEPTTYEYDVQGTGRILALKRIDELSHELQQSNYYKNVPPDTFVRQLSERIKYPYKLNQGKTLFCWAAAPVAYLYDKEPVKMVEAVFNLYTNGVFNFFNGSEYLMLNPCKNGAITVGTETFSKKNDPLCLNVVDQMVLLTFADNYKCWINIDRHFNPGDQRKAIWAGATLNKEKKVWEDLGYKVQKQGFDIFWLEKNKATIVSDAISEDRVVVLYINAAHFNKKLDKIRMMKRKPPFITTGSHYILVKSFKKIGDEYKITFWDDEGIQFYSISHDLFQRSVFGLAAISQNHN